MPTGFVFAPARLVKGENAYNEFRAIVGPLQEKAIKRAMAIWPGFSFGGLTPGPGQFGFTTFLPKDVRGGGTATFLNTQGYGSAGSWRNLFSYNVPRDEIHVWAGLSFVEPNLIFAQLRWQIEDKIFPIMDIEEAQGWNVPFTILFKQDEGKELIVPELQPVLIRAFQERGTQSAQQRVVPLGFMLYRTRALVITEGTPSN